MYLLSVLHCGQFIGNYLKGGDSSEVPLAQGLCPRPEKVDGKILDT